MTATTIGLGDIAPQTQAGRAYGIVHMLLSVILFTSILSTILSSLDRRVQVARKEEALRQPVDEQLITSLLGDGDSIGQCEFVLGMLEGVGLVQRNDYEPFLDQFERFDTSNTGRCTRGDLRALAAASRKDSPPRTKRYFTARTNINFESPQRGSTRSGSQRSVLRVQLQEQAQNLIVPTFLSAFGFLWCAVFGIILTSSGLLHGLAIGLILSPNPTEATFWKILLLVVLASACLLTAIAFLSCLLIDESTFYRSLDPLMHIVQAGTLEPTTRMLVTPGGYDDAFGGVMQSDTARALFGLYIACLVYGLYVDGRTSVCAARCIQRERQKKRSASWA